MTIRCWPYGCWMDLKRTSNLPLLLTLEDGVWHEIEIDMTSVDDDDCKNDKGWSCYLATINGEEGEEIPFWAMEAFADMCEALPKKAEKDTALEVQYKRIEKKGLNTCIFRVV